VFVNCKTAVQVHWDWAWTMQDIVVESCKTGIVIVGGVSANHFSSQITPMLILT
jgi:deoxyhypusine synthase